MKKVMARPGFLTFMLLLVGVSAIGAEVSVTPFLLPAGKAVVGSEMSRMEVNLPLLRRIVLKPSDVESVAVSVAADAPPSRIHCVASGKDIRPGEAVDLAAVLPREGVRLKKGERLALVAWKSSWHWSGSATFERCAVSCGGRTAAFAAPGEDGKTPLGDFAYFGFSKRESLPELKALSPCVADGAAQVKVPGARGTFAKKTERGIVLGSAGRASFDASNDWAPAVVFTAAESGVYRLSGKLSFAASGDKPALSWMVGIVREAAPSIRGLKMDFYRLLKPGKGVVADGDYDPAPLWSVEFGKDIRFSGDVARAVRKWLSGEWPDCGVCARVVGSSGTGGAVRFTRDAYAKVKVKDYPHHTLFEAPVKIKPGVYAERRDGRLYYDGRRLRLWSMVKDGTGERYRQMGMNGWRAWFGGDFYSAESAKAGRPMDYTKGDGSKLDRFDARFADMKEHDVFVMFGTLIGLGMDVKHFASDGSWLHERHAGDPDWKEWQAAALKVGGGCSLLAYLDDRLWEVRLRHAENVLNHLNPYTGKRYAEDEAIVLVEINNEAGHVKRWVEYGFDKMPEHFKKMIAAKREKAGLSRPEDLQKFVMDQVDRRNREYIAFCRAQAPKGVGVNVVAFSCDSMYRSSVPWLWADAQGDSSTVSMYFWRNDTMLAAPPGFYVIDSNRLDGKMNVIYETGRGRPSRYRAETPYSLAVMCDWQDFDIVDWHGSWFGDKSAEQLLAGMVMPPGTSHYWEAVHLEHDPVMTAAIAMAGRLYLAGVVGTAEDPAVYTIGPDAVYGRAGWNGVGGSEMSQRVFTRGAKLRFDMDQKEPVLVDGRPPQKLSPPEGAVKTGKYATWDWENERLVIDAPQAKVYVGPAPESFAFSDGIVLSGVNSPWIAFSMISRDGRPLAESAQSAWVSAVFDARNTGFEYDYGVQGGPVEQAKAVKNRGHAPVVVTPVSYAVSFPRKTDFRYTAYDFALRKTRTAEKKGGNALVVGPQTDWMGVVDFTARGANASAVIVPSPGAVRIAERKSASGGERTDAARAAYWSPLPDVSWGDSYARARRMISDGSMPHVSLSPANGRTIALLEAVFLMKMPANVEIRYEGDFPVSMSIEFTQAPAFVELVAGLKRELGNPVKESITQNAFEQSEVVWSKTGKAGTLSVKATETQGVVRLALSIR